MFRNMLVLVIVFSFCVCSVQAAHYNSTWVGGSYGQWENAANWDPSIVPENGTDTFSVIINGGTVELTENHSINSVDANDTDGTVNLKRWTINPVVLTVSNGFTNHGELDTPNTAHLHIHGPLINTVGAKIDIVSEELRVYGVTGIQNYGRIYIDPDAELKSEESDINNAGVLAMRGGFASAVQTFINNTEGIIEGYGGIGSQQIINEGFIESIGGTLQLFCETISNTGGLKNSPGTSIRTRIGPSNQSNEGLIEVYSEGAIVFDCNLANEPNALINIHGGTLAAGTIVQKAGAKFEGFGGITGDVVIDPNGIISLTGPTNIVGDVEIGTNATLEISDGTTLVTGHTTNNGTIHMKGGRIIPQGGFTNNGTVIWEPGLYNNIADFNLDGDVNLQDFAEFADVWLWQAGL